jgi:hypothetical protein
VRENGHNKGHDITCLPAMQLPTSSMPSWVVLGSTLPMHISGVRGIHWQDTCVEKHGTRTCHEQPCMTTAANRNQGQQDPLRGEKLLPRTPFDHVLPPFLSLSCTYSFYLCNLLPLWYKRESRSPSQGGGRASFLLLPSLSRGALPLTILLLPPVRLGSHIRTQTPATRTTYPHFRDLRPSSLSCPFVPSTINQCK